jgi:hypothetical protein
MGRANFSYVTSYRNWSEIQTFEDFDRRSKASKDLISVLIVIDVKSLNDFGVEMERLKRVHTFVVALNGWGESSLVTNIACVLAVLGLDDRLQGVVHLTSHDHSLSE